MWKRKRWKCKRYTHKWTRKRSKFHLFRSAVYKKIIPLRDNSNCGGNWFSFVHFLDTSIKLCTNVDNGALDHTRVEAKQKKIIIRAN